MSQALSLPQSEDLRKRILIVSDSVKRKTGYSTVARNIIKNLYALDKYKIAQLGLADIPIRPEFPIQYYSNVKSHRQCCGKGHVIEYVEENSDTVKYLELCPFGTLHPNQTPCTKAENEESDAYGHDSIYFVVEHFKPDIIIPINDLWGLYNIVHLKSNTKFKFLPYLAIDSECLFPAISAPSERQGLPNINTLDVISKAHKAIVFTDWAKEVINRTSRTITRKDLGNLDVIPHGVDTSIWKPLPNKDFLRNKYFSIEPKDNIFLLGSINRSQPRKRLDAIIQALQIIKKSYPKLNVRCHFHCCLEDKLGWNLIWLAKYYDVEEMCIFDAKLKPGIGPSDQIMNEIANCYNAHISLSTSEGWALTTLETMAAGVPNIALNYSAIGDWGKGAVYLIEPAAYEHEPRTGFVKAVADIHKAAQAIKILADSSILRKEYSKKSLALANKLNWSKICSTYWEKMLDSVDISDLDKNRWNTLKLDHRTFTWTNLPENPTTMEFELPVI